MGSSCATTTAPRRWLPSASDARTDPFGAWAEVGYASDSSEAVADGELIEVSEDRLLLLTDRGPLHIPWHSVKRAKLTVHKYGAGGILAWTLVGTLSTVSHGFYLALSAPVWLITGSAAGLGASWDPVVEYPGTPRSELNKYARFPQGMGGFNPEQLRSRSLGTQNDKSVEDIP